MKIVWLHIILLFTTATLWGQKIVYPDLKKEGLTVENFVPANWRILAITQGDLNKDKLEDVAVIIQNTEPTFILKKGSGEQACEYDANPRILMVLFKKPNGGYRLADFSNTFILRNNNPNRIDPFKAFTISSGVLTIDFHFYYAANDMEMTCAAYKFRYQNDDLCLIGSEIINATKSTGALVNYSFNFMTGKMCIKKWNTLKDSESDEEWKSFKLDKLKSLQLFSQPFTWDIEGVRL